jgi:hypothetical protein
MRLLNLSLEEINSYVEDLETETKAIKLDILRICWFMRGGVTLNEAYALDRYDRESISKIIEENMETTKKTGLPFF